ncbi:MAG: hypothetical protein KDI29_10360 [Pseudomonadales bacterium]|nr:hypothetical protein [Pseudomonadales bacterium]
MSIDITFTLSNDDLKRFEEIVTRAKQRVEQEDHARQVEEAAAQLIEKARNSDLPQFIEERLLKIETLLNMVQDTE